MRFSSRTPADLDPNDVSAAADAARAAGHALIDLTSSNPTTAALPGAVSACERIAAALAAAAHAPYAPDPRGLRSAREAVVAYHATRGIADLRRAARR